MTNSDFIIKLDLSAASVQRMWEDVSVKAYPNPTSDKITIELEENKNIQECRIYDMQGALVKSQNINMFTNSIKLNVEELSIGKYYIEIQSDDRIINKSFVKE